MGTPRVGKLVGWSSFVVLAAACGDDGATTVGDGDTGAPGDTLAEVTADATAPPDATTPDATAGTDTSGAGDTNGDSATTDAPEDTAEPAPSAHIVFPPPSATTAESIVVRGTATATTAITGLTVAGVAATSSDGFATWRAVVPLALGDNPLPLAITTAAGTTSDAGHAGVARWATEEAGQRGAGAWPGRALGLGWDPDGAQVLVSDDVGDGLFVIDPADGTRTLISDSESGDGPGTGYAIVQPTLVAGRGATAWVADGALLVSIDLATGDRALVPGGELGDIAGLVLDPTSTAARLYVLAGDALVAVDPATGARTTVAGGDVGSGPALTNGIALTIDDVGARAWVLRVYQDEVIEVTLATGARRQILGANTTPRFMDPRHITWVASDGALVVVDDTTVVRVDPATGAKAVLAGDGPPVRGLYGLGASPLGVLAIDYVPEWEDPPQRAPLLFAIDPVEGTRVVLAR